MFNTFNKTLQHGLSIVDRLDNGNSTSRIVDANDSYFNDKYTINELNAIYNYWDNVDGPSDYKLISKTQGTGTLISLNV